VPACRPAARPLQLPRHAHALLLPCAFRPARRPRAAGQPRRGGHARLRRLPAGRAGALDADRLSRHGGPVGPAGGLPRVWGGHGGAGGGADAAVQRRGAAAGGAGGRGAGERVALPSLCGQLP
jgi:hypothetical protein